MSKKHIELSAEEVKVVYDFAINRIALICLSASPKSLIFRKGIKVIKSQNKTDLMAFIKSYYRLKTKP